MDLATIASLAEAAAVVAAVVFGLIQLRHFRSHRQRESSFTLMHSLQTPAMLKGLMLLDKLPHGIDWQQLEDQLGDDVLYLQTLLGTWESLGILVFHGEVSLDLVDDFYSGSIVQSWDKLNGIVEEIRTQTGRQTRWEWFQWLAERMHEREVGAPPIPAHIQHRPSPPC